MNQEDYYRDKWIRLRKAMRITQKELADQIGCSLSLIEAFERDTVSIPLHYLLKAVESFGMTPTTFFCKACTQDQLTRKRLANSHKQDLTYQDK